MKQECYAEKKRHSLINSARCSRLSAGRICQAGSGADKTKHSQTAQQHSDNLVPWNMRNFNIQAPNTKDFVAATPIGDRILLVNALKLWICWGAQLFGAALLA
jgi:hypothetical protein